MVASVVQIIGPASRSVAPLMQGLAPIANPPEAKVSVLQQVCSPYHLGLLPARRLRIKRGVRLVRYYLHRHVWVASARGPSHSTPPSSPRFQSDSHCIHPRTMILRSSSYEERCGRHFFRSGLPLHFSPPRPDHIINNSLEVG